MNIEKMNDELLDSDTQQDTKTHGHRPTSINQDIKHSASLEDSSLDNHEIQHNNKKHQLKY